MGRPDDTSPYLIALYVYAPKTYGVEASIKCRLYQIRNSQLLIVWLKYWPVQVTVKQGLLSLVITG